MSREFTDQLFYTIQLKNKPMRIVSLVPSQTEFLYDVGASSQLVGVTKFCVHPEVARKEKQIVGGTKNYHADQIRALQPDLIIGNKEENVKQSIDALRKDFPVWMSDVRTLEDAYEMMLALGDITGHEATAGSMVEKISDLFERLPSLPERRVLYFIWKEPYMVAGSDTFIDHMLRRIGLVNAAGHMSRYPVLTETEIRDLKPGLIFLSSEPYPFRENDVESLAVLCRSARVMRVDGEFFSWYGSRLLHAPEYFSRLLSTAL